EGPRPAWQPVKELTSLRAKSHHVGSVTLQPGGANPLAGLKAELVELRAEFEPGDATEVDFGLCGATIVYESARQELMVNGHRASAPLQNGKQHLIVLADKTSLEVFASDGLTYVPMPFIAK